MLTKFRARRKARRNDSERLAFIRANRGCCWCKTERDWSEFYTLGTRALSEDQKLAAFREIVPTTYLERPQYTTDADLSEREVANLLAWVTRQPAGAAG